MLLLLRSALSLGLINRSVYALQARMAATASHPADCSAECIADRVDDRVRASLFGLFAADATAMPVHWMYG